MPRLAGREAAACGRAARVAWLLIKLLAHAQVRSILFDPAAMWHIHPAIEAYLGCCCGASRKGACMRDCVLPLAAAAAGTVHGAVCSWELYVRLNSQVWLCCCSGRR